MPKRSISEEARQGHFTEVRTRLAHASEGEKREALIGLAIGGHLNQVEELLGEGGDINDAIFGYARGGHFMLVNELLEQPQAKVDQAILGYIKGFHHGLIKDLLKRDLVEPAMIRVIISEYIAKEHFDQLEELSREGLIELDHQVIFKEARKKNISEEARQGHFTEVRALLEQGASKREAITGLAIGGHWLQVNELLKERSDIDVANLNDVAKNDAANVANLNAAIFGYARGGHFIHVNELLKQPQARVDQAILGYMNGFHYGQIKNLIKDKLVEPEMIEVIISEYIANEHFDQIEELLLEGLISQDQVVPKYKEAGLFEKLESLPGIEDYVVGKYKQWVELMEKVGEAFKTNVNGLFPIFADIEEKKINHPERVLSEMDAHIEFLSNIVELANALYLHNPTKLLERGKIDDDLWYILKNFKPVAHEALSLSVKFYAENLYNKDLYNKDTEKDMEKKSETALSSERVFILKDLSKGLSLTRELAIDPVNYNKHHNLLSYLQKHQTKPYRSTRNRLRPILDCLGLALGIAAVVCGALAMCVPVPPLTFFGGLLLAGGVALVSLMATQIPVAARAIDLMKVEDKFKFSKKLGFFRDSRNFRAENIFSHHNQLKQAVKQTMRGIKKMEKKHGAEEMEQNKMKPKRR